MNYLKFSFLISMLLLVASCSSEDGIEGEWLLASISLASCPDDIPEITLNSDDGCILLFDESLCITIVFESEEKVLVTYNYDDDEVETEAGTYSDNGNSIMLCFDGDCQTFKRDEDTLILNEVEDGCEAAYVFRKG